MAPAALAASNPNRTGLSPSGTPCSLSLSPCTRSLTVQAVFPRCRVRSTLSDARRATSVASVSSPGSEASRPGADQRVMKGRVPSVPTWHVPDGAVGNRFRPDGDDQVSVAVEAPSGLPPQAPSLPLDRHVGPGWLLDWERTTVST